MASLLIIALLSAITLFVTSKLYSLRQNVLRAQTSGLKVVAMPVHILSVPWMLAQSALLPLARVMPAGWPEKWIPLLALDQMWTAGYEPFALHGTETFIAASPSQNVLYTCDPQFTTQFLRNPRFTKPLEMLALLNAFGPTLTSSDDATARTYRKIAAPFFNTSTMSRAFKETVKATSTFLDVYHKNKSHVQSNLKPILAKLSLHILGVCAYEKEGSCEDELLFKDHVPEGHKMSYADTMLGVDNDLPLISLTPPTILANSPLSFHKRGYKIFKELSKYLSDTHDQKLQGVKSGETKTGETGRSLLDLFVRAGESQPEKDTPVLKTEEVRGNMFIFSFAGHESNAQGVQFALLALACLPKLQAKLQEEIERITGGLPPDQWTYEKHFAAFNEGLVAAVINESLRLYTVIPLLLKQSTEPVSITVGNKTHVIPQDTIIIVNTSATHRNPRYWPAPKGKEHEGKPYALSSFNPLQWLKDDGKFLSPASGSYIPFSDGLRGCIGLKFATVELCVELARIFAEYSVELDVESFDGIDRSLGAQAQWEQARKKAEYEVSGGIAYNMTLRLTGDVPINFVPKGQEKYNKSG